MGGGGGGGGGDTERRVSESTEGRGREGIEGEEGSGGGGGREGDGKGEVQYSLLLNMTLDRRAVVVRREDGFEKRWVRRCGRCRTGVGYILDERGEVVYLLEEGLVETGRLS